MSTGICCLSSFFLIVCFAVVWPSASALASRQPSTVPEQYHVNDVVEEGVFGGAAAASAAAATVGSLGQPSDWRDSTKTRARDDGQRQGGVAKRTPIMETSGYLCCTGDIFCVRGSCESASSLVDWSRPNKRSQWRQYTLKKQLHLDNF